MMKPDDHCLDGALTSIAKGLIEFCGVSHPVVIDFLI